MKNKLLFIVLMLLPSVSFAMETAAILYAAGYAYTIGTIIKKGWNERVRDNAEHSAIDTIVNIKNNLSGADSAEQTLAHISQLLYAYENYIAAHDAEIGSGELDHLIHLGKVLRSPNSAIADQKKNAREQLEYSLQGGYSVEPFTNVEQWGKLPDATDRKLDFSQIKKLIAKSIPYFNANLLNLRNSTIHPILFKQIVFEKFKNESEDGTCPICMTADIHERGTEFCITDHTCFGVICADCKKTMPENRCPFCRSEMIKE